MPDNELKIKLQVQNKKANNQLKQTSNSIKDVENKAKGSEKELNRMRIATAGLRRSMGALRNNLLLVTFAFGGIGAAVGKTVKLYGQQQLAEKKLESALGRTSDALLNQASALQEVTTFGDENIIQAQALIAAFTDDEEAIKRATVATLDLASAKGMDLFAAADLVAKTLGSSTNAMSRYGIEVTGAVGSTERLDTLTQNIAKTFGGQAKAEAETMAGALIQAGNAAGDAGEKFGKLLEPIIIRSAKAFKGAAEAVGTYIENLRTLSFEEILVSENVTRLQVELEKLQGQLNITSRQYSRFGHTLEKQAEIDSLNERIEGLTQRLQDLFFPMGEELKFDLSPPPDPIPPDYKRGAKDYLSTIEKFKPVFVDLQVERNKQTKQELENYAKSSGSARDAMATVIKAEMMEGISGLIASIFKTFPFPLSAVLAAGAGATVSAAFDRNLKAHVPQFAEGGDFVTSGKQLIMVGDNPSGKEHVQITPLGGDPAPNAPTRNNITLNISAPLVDETIVDTIIPAINDAVRRGETLATS